MRELNLKICLFIILFFCYNASGFRCDRRPYGSTTQASAADGRFKLSVVDADSYIPEQLYTVQIKETDGDSSFTAFVISAEGDIKPDPRNPRRTITQFPGNIRPQTSDTAKFSDRCLYSVEQAISSEKSSVEVYWQAPPSGSGCVTLRAMVAENEEVWFEDGAPLTQRICEDIRQPDDVSPQIQLDCKVCDEAKYEVSFSGIWSRNTHPQMYPENDWIPHYSDLVGVTHSTDYTLWIPGSLASDGMKDLAEYANSSLLETEIREKINDGVRTLLKGKGHGYRKMNYPSYAFARADKTNHLLSVAVALYPSPDWFLGVTRFELCQEDGTWLQERELNLYPWDAGTDSGVSYESANIVTFPQDAITRVEMSSYDKNSPFYETDMKDLHPFGKLNVKLIRTYHRDCEETTEADNEESSDKVESGGEDTSEPQPSRYHNPDLASGDDGGTTEASIEVDPESPEDCPLSQWNEWSVCEGACENGKIIGYKWRERYHLVNGEAVEKYDPSMKSSSRTEVPQYCKEHYDVVEETECEEECDSEENEPTAERRKMNPIAPGKSWNSKKRHLSRLTRTINE